MKCCKISAGTLRHSISIERATKTPDGAGGTTVTWASIGTVQALVKPVSGSERVFAQRIEANTSHLIYTRWRDILPSDRVNFNGRVMQIRAIINMEELDRWAEIHAQEGQAT